jgi:hypothetical protein
MPLIFEGTIIKGYVDAMGMPLRAAERWAYGFHEYAPVEKEHEPTVYQAG